MDARWYIDEIKIRLALSDCIQTIEIVEERIVLSDRGYFRARLTLTNDDFLEIAEYFVCEGERCIPKRYRYQWMDSEQNQLRKRWDNAEHFPDLTGFPHHVHIGVDNNVESSIPLSIFELIDIVEQEIETGETHFP